MANFSISSFPSDLPCTSSEHIYFSGKVSRSYREKLGIWAESSPPSAARNEQFSAIEYEYKAPSVEESSDTESVLPIDDSIEEVDGTVIHTPHQNKTIAAPVNNQSLLGFDPLSSFTVHQTDKPVNYEHSYIEKRVYPTTVRQVHGSLSLHNEKLIKAITDSTDGELNWDRLKHLDLSNKSLTSLHGLDQYCPSLITLYVDGNSIEHLNGIPKSLRHLSVNNNRVSSLTAWDHLPNLYRVHAAKNRLVDLDGFSRLDHLTELDVSENRIQDIKGLHDLMDLHTVNLSHNQLESLKWGNWVMKYLTHLDVSYNRLWFVDNLDVFPRLETLNLEANAINSFGEATEDRHCHLRKLNLNKNSVMSFNFHRFFRIEDLNLDENLILSAKSLDGLEQATSLVKLSLRAQQESRQGQVNDLVSTILITHLECKELYLSENPVTDGHFHMPDFQQCSIRKLEMARCDIMHLPTSFGYHLPNCRDLNLNCNRITDVTELRGMWSLEDLQMTRNQLTKLKHTVHILGKLPIRSLDIRDNAANGTWYHSKRGAEVDRYRPGAGPYELPIRYVDMSVNWHRRLQGTLRYQKLVMHYLLVEHCPHLKEFDGAIWSRNWQNDTKIYQELAEAGYVKPRRSGSKHAQ